MLLRIPLVDTLVLFLKNIKTHYMTLPRRNDFSQMIMTFIPTEPFAITKWVSILYDGESLLLSYTNAMQDALHAIRLSPNYEYAYGQLAST